MAGSSRGEQIAWRMRSLPLPLLAAALSAAALAARPARAALGEPAASVAADRRALSAASRGTTDRGAYAVHELSAGGTAVREYAAPGGPVFAVAWEGLAAPDLALLLGGYAGEYQEQARREAGHRGQRAQRVAAAHVVVERWGHMRDRHGRAYLPALLPPGVTVDEIR
jgi:hypothetical protein